MEIILSNEPLPVNQLGRQLARILAVKEIDDALPFKKISEERRKSLFACMFSLISSNRIAQGDY